MAIVKMNKISIIGLENDKDYIMDILMKMGMIEITNLESKLNDDEWADVTIKDGDESKVSILEAEISKTKTVLECLEKYDTTKKGLFEPKRVISKSAYNDIIENKSEVQSVVDKISTLLEKLSSLRSEENKINNLIGTLTPWEKLQISLEETSTKYTRISLGVVPSIVDTNNLKEELNNIVPESYLEVVNADADQAYIFVVCYADLEDEAIKILKKYGYAKVEFKDLYGTVSGNITKSKERIIEIGKERKEVEKNITSLITEKQNIELLYDYLCLERDKKRVLTNLLKTDKTFMLKGWIPEEAASIAEKEIIENYDCIIEFEKPEKDEDFPVLLKNNSVIKPFEFITELYSLPSSKTFDSNLIMAPFYFVFFGLMLSDAGYGLIIALLTGIVLTKFKLQGGIHKLIKLIFFGGISTFIWGVLFGGWFGNVFEIISGSTPFIFQPKWFNPLDDPMRLLTWSLVFGGIQIYVGMALNAYQLIKDGQVLDAVFDVGSWYIFLTGLVMLLVGLPVAGKYLAIIGALMLVLTQGRKEKNIVMKVVKGIGSLYNVTAYLADLLSYSRLLALGLATGVIASVVNTVGSLFGFGPVGIIIFIIVFIGGHSFNIVINLLGAYVHSSRLQYVEFFGKYFDGGGRAFNPFKRNTKYVEIK